MLFNDGLERLVDCLIVQVLDNLAKPGLVILSLSRRLIYENVSSLFINTTFDAAVSAIKSCE